MSARTGRESSDLSRAMAPAAREILGEPNDDLSSDEELRFGTRGSVVVKVKAGTWFDHAANNGGGVLDFVKSHRGTDKDGALAWLRDRGHLSKPGGLNIVARYPYLSADGDLLFEVVRFDPKDFRQRRPDGAGGWIWKMQGVQLCLYRLPSIIAAVSTGTLVYVVEGEKSADALFALGLTATCSPGGAKKWRREYSPALTGAHVVILPDNDEAGVAHASMVAANLNGIAASVRLLRLPDLPEKGDVHDWLAAGGTALNLASLVTDAPEPENAPRDGSSPASAEGLEHTEDGIAQAFTAQHASQLRYCHHSQHWFVWSGSHWRMEQSKLAFSWVRDICRRMAMVAEDKDRPKISKAAFAASVERFAQSDRAFAVTAENWDQNPWLLGTPSGTVDLRTGLLRDARREDHITKRTATAPAPAGTPHPIWSAFLDQATAGDKELQAFLQRLIGYCLTGDVTEEVLAFLYGEGGTGKGTFLGTIVAALADYAVAVPIEVFTAGSRLNLEYYRAQMAGARLVTASETEAGASWAESQIKEMTGNEAPLSGRQPYGKVFTFLPRFKIMLVGNHAPRLKGRSKAMERRMRIAPFKYTPAVPDHDLKERLRTEQAAILRWCIDGCLTWQAQRLGTCQAVAKETDSYFAQQDHFGRWLAERCVLGTSIAPVSEKPSKLLADFLAWARDGGEASLTSGEFRELIERTSGLRYATNKGTQWVRGLALKVEGSDARNQDDEF